MEAGQKAELELGKINVTMDLQLRNQQLILQQNAEIERRLTALESQDNMQLARVEGDEARKTEIVRAENAPAPKAPAK